MRVLSLAEEVGLGDCRRNDWVVQVGALQHLVLNRLDLLLLLDCLGEAVDILVLDLLHLDGSLWVA